MDDYWWSAILFRILLPLVIGIAIFIRPSITSYVYLVVGCYMPFFSVPTKISMAKGTGTYLKILLITCILTTTFIISFYLAVFFPEDNLDDLEPCTTLEIALRTVGVINFDGLSAQDIIPWCLPEPLMLFTSVIFTLIFKKLSQDETNVLRTTKQADDTNFKKTLNRKKYILMMLHFGKYFVVFLCCLSGVLRATAFGAVYYLFFLVVITYWACNCSLGRVYGKMLACLIPIIFINITVIFWYQFQYFQDSELTTSYNIWGRLFNLVDLKTYKDCSDPRLFYFHPHTLATYSVPVCLYVLYMLVVLVAREILQAEDGCKGLFMAMIKRKPVSFKNIWAKAVLQIHEQKFKKESMTADKIKAFIEQTLQFIIYISFIAANFVMMLWAIIYVSWKTLVLMVWANVLWLLPYRKKLTLYSSPLVVIWIWFVLITAYLYSMDLNHEELPPQWGFVNLSSGLDQQSDYKAFHLMTRSLFAVIIFVTMRQMFQEIQLKKDQKKLASAMGLERTGIEELEKRFAFLERFQKSFLEFFATWWIWVVILTMIWLTFWATSNVFRILFVFLAMVFITTFQFCPFKAWKKFLRVYWWIVILYSMVNFFAVYFYQISVSRRYMLMFLAEQYFQELGIFNWSDPKKTTAILATPLFFQIAVVIQLHYLHKEFDRITSPTPPEEKANNEDDAAKSNPDSKWKKVSTVLTHCKKMLFKIMELRLRHVVLIIGWFMCLYDMCALQFALVILFTASCVLGHVFTTIVIYGASLVVQILIVLRLLYMKLMRDHSKWNYVGHYTRNGKSFNKTLNVADWLGFHESRYGYDFADFGQLAWCFLYVFAVTLNRVMSIRKNNYLKSNLESTKPGVLYPQLTYENCHESLKSTIQFLINYGFYKFGCEICLCLTTVVMMVRMDAGAIAMSFWLMSVYSLNRNKLRMVWLPSLIIIAVAVPFQYWACLAWTPTNWDNSLTRFWSQNDFLLRIQQFCYLLNMAHPPNKTRIRLDFLLLFLMSRQWRSFRQEWKNRGRYFAPGGNEDVSALIDDKDVENPVPDFVTYTRSHLDIIKRGIINTWFYLALAITFLAGTLRVTLYSYGYIIITFMFAWEGTDMFLRPPRVIKKRWNMLIAYNIFVMMLKTSNQIFGCIFNYSDYIPLNCHVFRIFTLGCVDKFQMTEGVPGITAHPVCKTNYQALGLELDCLCFFFLIIQQRIFKSFHFFHLVNEAKAQTILADRGLEDEVRLTRSEKREKLDKDEAQIRKNIDEKLSKIRAAHQKVQGEVYQRRMKSHDFVLKSCDYYIFDDQLLAEEIPIMTPKEDKLDTATNSYDPMPLTQYFELWQQTDMKTVLAERTLRRQQKAAILEGKKPEDVRKMVPIKDTDVPERASARYFEKFLHVLTFFWGFVESFIVTVTGLLNRFTKEFRSTLNDMQKDRIILKEKTKYNEGVRLGSHGVWEPTSSFTEILGEVTKITDPDSETDIVKYSIYEKLITALWYLIWSHTEWICYFIMIYNHLIRSTFISLPLVMLTFCWGSLTVPKPTRTFWVLNIAIVLVILFMKCFMALRLAPWYQYEHPEVFEANQYFPPYSIGVGDNTPVNMNFALLVGFLFHRMVLQSMGLWKTIRSRPASLLENGYYNLEDRHLTPATPQLYSPSTLDVQSTGLGISSYFPKSIFQGFTKYAENFKIFVQELITPSLTQIPVDVYTPMFMCDFVNLALLIFFFDLFRGVSEGQGLINFIKTNSVPPPFIVIILGHFSLIVLDRMIYLKKNRFAKLVFHYFQVMCIHVYLFVLFPIIGHIKFIDTPLVQLFYFFKCLYFLFSAYQIRNGYPSLISFHCLWHGLGFINRYGYKLYRMVPYFFEMRTVLDWICSDSSLGVSDWFKMEEITQNIFDERCQQNAEEKDKEELSDNLEQSKGRTKKYITGGLLYFLLILTVIFPFLLFSLGDTVGVKTHPAKFKLLLFMGGAEPIFQSYASQKSVRVLSDTDFQNLTVTFNNIEQSEDIFDKFRSEDVVVITWSPNSLTDWTVSPGAYEELMRDVLNNDTLSFRLEIQYVHIGNGGVKVQSTFGQSSQYPPLPNVHRQNLINILQANQSLDAVVWIPLMFPKFLLITQEAKPVSLTIMGEQGDQRIYDEYMEDVDLQNDDDDDDSDVKADPTIHRNLLATLKIDNGRKWWHIEEECDRDDDNYYYYLKDLVHNSCNVLVMYTFNERVFSDSMSFFTSSGIIGLYLLYFMLVIGIIRDCRILIGQIWIEDLPNCDLLYRKCLEVYIARDMGCYELEEELFAELIFIMRSRELMIKLTSEDTPEEEIVTEPAPFWSRICTIS